MASAPAGEVQDQVEVVNHEVEHHGDVGAAGLEGGEALALEVERMVQQRFGGPQRLVEALDMSHLQLDALARRLGDQRVGLEHGGRERFLHEHRHTAPQHMQANLGVVWRGDGNGDRTHQPKQLIEVFEGPAAARGRHFSSTGRDRCRTRRPGWPRVTPRDGGRDGDRAPPHR